MQTFCRNYERTYTQKVLFYSLVKKKKKKKKKKKTNIKTSKISIFSSVKMAVNYAKVDRVMRVGGFDLDAGFNKFHLFNSSEIFTVSLRNIIYFLIKFSQNFYSL